MTVPLLDGLSDELRAELAEASSVLPNLIPITPETVEVAPDDNFRALRHELSDHYLALHPPGRHDGRSPLESYALGVFEAGPDELAILPAKKFCDSLHSLNNMLTGGRGGWRTGFVKLSDDKAGNQIYFPHVSSVSGQLERLRLLITDQNAAPPIFTAAIAYAVLLNCHPFTDGNGRTARALFNHLLHRGGMPANVYLPLYEIARRSHGGYEIALRMAELRGDWAPLLHWLMDALRCCRDLANVI